MDKSFPGIDFLEVTELKEQTYEYSLPYKGLDFTLKVPFQLNIGDVISVDDLPDMQITSIRYLFDGAGNYKGATLAYPKILGVR